MRIGYGKIKCIPALKFGGRLLTDTISQTVMSVGALLTGIYLCVTKVLLRLHKLSSKQIEQHPKLDITVWFMTVTLQIA